MQHRHHVTRVVRAAHTKHTHYTPSPKTKSLQYLHGSGQCMEAELRCFRLAVIASVNNPAKESWAIGVVC